MAYQKRLLIKPSEYYPINIKKLLLTSKEKVGFYENFCYRGVICYIFFFINLRTDKRVSEREIIFIATPLKQH